MGTFNRGLEHIEKKQWTLRNAINYIKSLQDSFKNRLDTTEIKISKPEDKEIENIQTETRRGKKIGDFWFLVLHIRNLEVTTLS